MQAPAFEHARDERRRGVTRRLTRGPLDSDDPLAPSASTSTARVLSPARGSSPQDGASRGIDDMPAKDFSFLQDPAAYHVLPTTSLPAPFVNAPHPLTSPIDALLQSGHYRLAAHAAARNIVSAASPTDSSTLLYLLHIRLACLCLINEHALAAQESAVLGDLSSTFYRHPFTNAHIVPWDLRLLVVRLSALSYSEWRKGIMGYYELARECRENIVKASTPDADKATWRSRLRDCGIRVANLLVEMGDLEGAGRHLATLSGPDDAARDISIMETLVWLRVGDIASARRSLSLASTHTPSSMLDGVLAALIQLADSEYDAATSSFHLLHEQFPSDAMTTTNLAVCLLYTGRIADAKHVLSKLVDDSPPFHSAVFNLSTVYELCTERSRDKKVQLAEKLASRKGGGGVGWEWSTAEFKL